MGRYFKEPLADLQLEDQAELMDEYIRGLQSISGPALNQRFNRLMSIRTWLKESTIASGPQADHERTLSIHDRLPSRLVKRYLTEATKSVRS